MSVHNHYKTFLTKSSFNDISKKTYRHSCLVRVLKFLLPFCALTTVFVFYWFTFFFVPSASDLVILNSEEGGIMKPIMLNPKLEGYTSLYEPYWFKAEKAYQDYTRSGIIELQNITAEVFAGKQGRVFLDAQKGVYDNINGHLQLDKPFTITTDGGMTAQFMDADINLSERQLSTNKRVKIQRSGLCLIANALKIKEKKQSMYFEGGVHLVLDKQ
ncbi:LPS export ABC transporter periplasmic protein LptC [Bartonella sp. CB189]|uniref:LPS export ABC transporter periplasmic protein LptC n=1 Tax=Bartonella sp. CB189 TaxID=3112254 RepID=UPI002F9660B1